MPLLVDDEVCSADLHGRLRALGERVRLLLASRLSDEVARVLFDGPVHLGFHAEFVPSKEKFA